jgi:hypothetical protein
MAHPFALIRRFRFNLPQRIAAALLALFLAQGLWLIRQQTMTAADYKFARCGREVWEHSSPISGYYTSCGNIHDGILTYRLAGLPLTLNYLFERTLDVTRKPEDRLVQTTGEVSSWEMRHQLTHALLLLRLPFLFVGCSLGAAIWWVTRRLFGNFGGYLALGLYCFSPGVLRASVTPNPELLATLGLFGGLYCCIGVAHSMQGPRARWRPRIVLLAAAFALAAGSHIVALPLAALFGLVAMLWIVEGKRGEVVPVILISIFAAMLLLFAAYGFSVDAFSAVFQSGSALLALSTASSAYFFTTLHHAGIILGAVAALLLYLGVRRSRYFGNTTPLLCFVALIFLVTTGVASETWLWALPFLLTFIAGVFADAFEGTRGKLMLGAAAVLVVLQAVFCLLSLPGLV